MKLLPASHILVYLGEGRWHGVMQKVPNWVVDWQWNISERKIGGETLRCSWLLWKELLWFSDVSVYWAAHVVTISRSFGQHRGMWTKSVWGTQKKRVLVTKTDGRMAFRVEKKHTLDDMFPIFSLPWKLVYSGFSLVVCEFFALDFLSVFFECFTGCFFGSERLYMWSRWFHVPTDLLTSRGPSYFQMLQDLAPKLSCSGWVMPPIMDDESIRCRIELVTLEWKNLELHAVAAKEEGEKR